MSTLPDDENSSERDSISVNTIAEIIETQRTRADEFSITISAIVQRFNQYVHLLRYRPDCRPEFEQLYLSSLLKSFLKSSRNWTTNLRGFEELSNLYRRNAGGSWWLMLDSDDKNGKLAGYVKNRLECQAIYLQGYSLELEAIGRIMDVLKLSVSISPANEATWDDGCRLLHDGEEWLEEWNRRVELRGASS